MKTPFLRIYSVLAFLFLILLANSCSKSSSSAFQVTVPIITTPSVIVNVTATTAQSGGIITSAGGGTITANGVCYSATNKTPTTADGKTSEAVSTVGTAVVTFDSIITGLTPNTLYYARAYATNSAGTGYGSVIQFTTNSSSANLVATVTTFAGNGTAGYLDGLGIGAQFNNPQGITIDSKNNLYVSDSYNNVIRTIAPDGTTGTFAGVTTFGYADGPAATAAFYAPKGSAFDSQGNLFVADYGNNVIRKITPAGIVSTFAGNGSAGYLDATTATSAEFNAPTALAFDATGNLYVADRTNNLIRKITPAGVVTTFAGTKTAGFINATGTAASFYLPNSLVVDASGNVYVADQGNHSIRKITSAGVVTTLIGNLTQSTLVNLPTGLAIDKAGDLFITDEGGRVLEYTASNTLYILAGYLNIAGFINGVGPAAFFNSPQAIAVDSNGIIYVADQNNSCIRKITVTKVD